jgi:hypothetical protein
MTIFDLHSAVLADYRDFIRSFLLIADERARHPGSSCRRIECAGACGRRGPQALPL